MTRLLAVIICICNFIIPQSQAQEQLEVEGAIILKKNSGNSTIPGTIRWNGHDFEGYTFYGWKSLTKPQNSEPCDEPDDYECIGIVLPIKNDPIPSITLSTKDITRFSGCNENLSASFSTDITDIVRTFTCDDLGDRPLTMFIWKDGELFEPCFGVHTFIDPNGYCN